MHLIYDFILILFFAHSLATSDICFFSLLHLGYIEHSHANYGRMDGNSTSTRLHDTDHQILTGA